jgi:glycosyltransferase involved in cell wall biosynthesis
MWSIERAVASCRNVNESYEIIVADDGSTDGSFEWLQEQGDVDVFRAEQWGQSWALNMAIQRAKGDYCRFLDSDDYILPGANDAQLKLAAGSGADIVVGACEERDEEENVLLVNEVEGITDFLELYLPGWPVPHYSAHVIKREFLQQHRFFNPYPSSDFSTNEDLRLMLELGLCEPSLAVHDEPTTIFVQHQRARLMYQSGLRKSGSLLQFLMIYQRTIKKMVDRDLLTPRRLDALLPVLWKLADMMARGGYLNDAADLHAWIKKLKPESQPPFSSTINRLIGVFGFSRTMRLMHWRRNFSSFFRGSQSDERRPYPVPWQAEHEKQWSEKSIPIPPSNKSD